MERIRIGCVKYLNTLPLVDGLHLLQDVELVSAVPSRLIGMLQGREVDVALASVIDAAAEGVSALAAGMIGSDGPTLTVRVFSRVPIEQIRTVGVDTDSHTSVVLMQIILARMHGVRPRVLDFDARERMVVSGRANQQRAGPQDHVGDVDALLLIGDKVVTDAPSPDEYPHQLDLGQAWKQLTGLPFVYAVWMCRAGEEGNLSVRTAAAVLDHQRRHNATRLDWIVSRHAAERGWPEDLAARYVKGFLTYDVGEAEREAVEKFIAWGHELGLCGTGPVRWADEVLTPGASVAPLETAGV